MERTLRRIAILPRQIEADALGGAWENFGPAQEFVRGSVIPSTGKLLTRPEGVRQVQTMCLLLPADAPVKVGDAVGVDCESPQWRCVDVQKWSAHVAVQVERI